MLCRNWHPPRFVYHCHAVSDCGHFKCRATESSALFSMYVVIIAWRLKERVLILACVVHFKVMVGKGIDWQLMCGGVDWSLERQVDQCMVPFGCSSCGSVFSIVSPHRSPRVSMAEGSKYISSEMRIRNHFNRRTALFPLFGWVLSASRSTTTCCMFHVLESYVAVGVTSYYQQYDLKLWL